MTDLADNAIVSPSVSNCLLLKKDVGKSLNWGHEDVGESVRAQD